MSLSCENTLSDLIAAGPDASSNLFRVTFEFLKDNKNKDIYKEFSFRTNTFATPAKTSTTVDLPYQDISILKVSPGVQLEKNITFSLRIDRDYALYKFLKNKMKITSDGHFMRNKLDEDIFCEISVEALKEDPSNNLQLQTAHSWVFHDCIPINVSSLTLSYNSAGIIEIPVTFIYSYLEETLS